MSKYILYLIFSSVWAQSNDPFVAPVKKHHGTLKEQRIQYLGYIKINETIYGFVRRVGGDIERFKKGNVPGMGKVTTITSRAVCMVKNQQHYCLEKTAQMIHWKMVEEK